MKYKLLALIMIFCSLNFVSFSQTEEDSVKMVINKLFTAMKQSDANSLKECFADSAIMQSIALNKQNKLYIRNDNVNEFAASISKLPKDSADERILFESVKVNGVLASVWCPYKFYYNGKFLHCGVDNFTLVKLYGSWKILYLIDTRRKHGCEEIKL
jgi:hypothetical protein